MSDFSYRKDALLEQLDDLLADAVDEAARAFEGERQSWEQERRVLEGDIADALAQSHGFEELAASWKNRYNDLQSKLSALV